MHVCFSYWRRTLLTPQKSSPLDFHISKYINFRCLTGSEGSWYDKWTKENVSFLSIPWSLESEPTGYLSENCSGLTNENEESYWAFDISCSQKRNPVCQDIKYFFRMRGLCLASVIDRQYKLIENLSGHRRMFLGPSKWSIKWHSTWKTWTLSNELFPAVYANTTTSTYPLGSYKWHLTGFDGCQNKPYTTLLTLSSCTDDEFTCDSGDCIKMTKR